MTIQTNKNTCTCLLLAELDICCKHFFRSCLSKKRPDHGYVLLLFLSIMPYVFLYLYYPPLLSTIYDL